jgi:alkanesulfonate monooxygenase SsuD/methylene tetrahydromethanopterin reductase-like flavin-dependent oxidoreductase (luciferase family)
MMRFGLFGSAQARRGSADPAEGFRAYVDYAVEAEALGFESAFLVEHHFTGIGQVSATLGLLAWVAARTTRLRLGTAVMVLPWHNPVLLAEEAATLDLMSGGRLDFGVGKGYRRNEFDGFAIDIAEAEARFAEALGLVLKAWTSDERFSHRGRFWRFENVLVEPAPLQRPHPPLWMAAGSEASIREVAARGANLLLDQFAAAATIAERIACFRRAVEAEGRRFDPAMVAVARNVFVTDDAAEREAALERLRRQHNHMIQLSRHAARPVASHILAYAGGEGSSEAAALYGNPDAVARGLAALADAGAEYVLVNGGGTSRENLRRFARDVMPGFNRASGSAL